HEARDMSLARRPEIGMAAERSHFRRGDSGQAPGPVLRISDEMFRFREEFRTAPLLIGELPAEIESRRYFRGHALGKGRPHLGVVRLDLIDVRKFVVHHWRGERALAE